MLEIISKSAQASGAFNGGQIVENKPIGFPQDGGKLKPYSSLFYWARAISNSESTLPLHPHRGFEIMSFVLEGKIKHYDTAEKVWKTLEAGDAQVIQAGSGIEHSEHMHEGAMMFQIWLDPDYAKSREMAASYKDYLKADFPSQEKAEGMYTTYVGESSPFKLLSPGISIFKLNANGIPFSWQPEDGEMYSCYVIKGEGQINGEAFHGDDFIKLEGGPFDVVCKAGTELFVIASPLQLDYPSYQEFMQAQFRNR
ncbi:MAG: pirin family protein [Saprospiraceae bacterium]|nr:pirin family protein [Saprospiraceae bacterium]